MQFKQFELLLYCAKYIWNGNKKFSIKIMYPMNNKLNPGKEFLKKFLKKKKKRKKSI